MTFVLVEGLFCYVVLTILNPKYSAPVNFLFRYKQQYHHNTEEWKIVSVFFYHIII